MEFAKIWICTLSKYADEKSLELYLGVISIIFYFMLLMVSLKSLTTLINKSKYVWDNGNSFLLTWFAISLDISKYDCW